MVIASLACTRFPAVSIFLPPERAAQRSQSEPDLLKSGGLAGVAGVVFPGFHNIGTFRSGSGKKLVSFECMRHLAWLHR